MCGTLDDNKNPHLFLDIAKIAIEQMPHLKFMWIGGTNNPEFLKQIKTRTTQLGLQDNVYWTGDVKDDFYPLFNCADGFLLTSLRESFSLVTLEALLLGLPVVANDCGGVSELLGKDAGIIERTSEKLAAAVVKCSQENYKVDAASLRKRGEEFDIRIGFKVWLELLSNFTKTNK